MGVNVLDSDAKKLVIGIAVLALWVGAMVVSCDIAQSKCWERGGTVERVWGTNGWICDE